LCLWRTTENNCWSYFFMVLQKHLFKNGREKFTDQKIKRSRDPKQRKQQRKYQEIQSKENPKQRNKYDLETCSGQFANIYVGCLLNRFIQNSPLQENCTSEPCTPIECPNQCSGRGVCGTGSLTGTCFCPAGIIGEDCNTVKTVPYQLDTTQTYTGSIYGKSPHLYYFQIDPIGNISTGNIDVQISLQKTSQTGKLLIYMSGGPSFIIPDETAPENLIAQFPYRNLEDRFYKELFVNDISRGANPTISILILNSIDIPVQYSITLRVQNSGPRVDIATLTLGILFGVGSLVSIALSVVLLIQLFYGRHIAKLQAKYI